MFLIPIFYLLTDEQIQLKHLNESERKENQSKIRSIKREVLGEVLREVLGEVFHSFRFYKSLILRNLWIMTGGLGEKQEKGKNMKIG